MADRPATPPPLSSVEDIFATTQPVRPTIAASVPPPPPAPRPVPLRPSVPSGRPPRSRLFFLVIGVVGVLGIAGAVAWTILGSGTTNDNGNSGNATAEPTNTTPPTANVNSNVPPPDEPPAGPPDQDRDGLTDAEERELGTKSDAVDTDGDGLSDLREVRLYQTDPRKTDSDGDTFSDGVEVQKGYNPNGDGLLRDLDQGISNINS